MTNVLIVEDSGIIRSSMERQLNASGDFHVRAAIGNAANAEIACMGGGRDKAALAGDKDSHHDLHAGVLIHRKGPEGRLRRLLVQGMLRGGAP